MTFAITKKAFEGDEYCGDECACYEQNDRVILCVTDGLGHGREAQLASSKAISFIAQNLDKPLKTIFAECNEAVQLTRGVALGMAVIDRSQYTLTYAGIGNTRAMMVTPEKLVRFSSNYGIIGGGYRRLTPESVNYHSDFTLILYTDGVREMIDISKYEPDSMQKPMTLSLRIIEDWSIPSDDAAVIVYYEQFKK